ncbi:MFS general substrate transporter [Basidiobolus meristosporus CBS 931.73]|uniref:MFS general substrate transporter n=1 Tax=Basidiobolus meristosporus CBS 931.73 TaxID=1314790 RepID=A0A1Y1XYF9_9FUNG|nr:MFS general substrate transporter [Basidiobolus meristosporus CBS 931.73]|eukprot:ORX90394.1 MFS general substrate transporter [Basidiobolus meristosporus CBS 931.73]
MCEIPEFSRRKKASIVVVVALAGMVGPISTNMFVPSLAKMREEFGMSESVGNLTVTVFMIFLAIAPLLWGPASDKVGRRAIYLISISIFIVASVICGFSINSAMMISMRGVQAIGSSAVLAIGAGTISDIFEPSERGTAFGLYYLGPLLGPVLGPVIGGILGDRAGWRVIFFMLAGLGLLVLVLIILALPETMPEIRARNYARQNNLTPPTVTKKVSIIQPLLMLQYPSAVMVILYACSILASVYSYTTSVPITFRSQYGLDTSQVGLLYLSSGVGNIIGALLGGRLSDYSLRKLRVKYQGTRIPPEARFNLVWFGSIFFPVSLLCYGWLVRFNVNIVGPLVTMFLIGFNSTYVFSNTSTYIVDIFPGYGASATATSNCLRYLSGAIASGIVSPLLDLMGPGWLFTGLALLTILMDGVLYIVYKHGERWRPNLS